MNHTFVSANVYHWKISLQGLMEKKSSGFETIGEMAEDLARKDQVCPTWAKGVAGCRDWSSSVQHVAVYPMDKDLHVVVFRK